MITNPEIIPDKYVCSEKIARYLIYECHIPLLGYNEDRSRYYFTDNKELRKCLEKMPLGLKMLNLFVKNR